MPRITRDEAAALRDEDLTNEARDAMFSAAILLDTLRDRRGEPADEGPTTSVGSKLEEAADSLARAREYLNSARADLNHDL